MYFDEYTYEEIENDRNREKILINIITNSLKNKYGYFAIKVTRISGI